MRISGTPYCIISTSVARSWSLAGVHHRGCARRSYLRWPIVGCTAPIWFLVESRFDLANPRVCGSLWVSPTLLCSPAVSFTGESTYLTWASQHGWWCGAGPLVSRAARTHLGTKSLTSQGLTCLCQHGSWPGQGPHWSVSRSRVSSV
jgi:hypothetical protein